MDTEPLIADECHGCEEIAHALAVGEFEVYYQPIVDLGTLEVAGAEALVRWPAAGIRGYVVDDLVESVESCGLVGQLDEWVLRTALDQLAAWQTDAIVSSSFNLCINASSLDFDSPDFPGRMARAISDSGVDPTGVVIEVTETRALSDLAGARRSATAVHEMGMRLALDDFGSGYSNFARLQALSFDIFKIDRCFTEVCDTTVGSAIVTSLVELARALGTRVVVEGVETTDQADRMFRAGCHEGQGYLWAPAVPAALMEEFLRGTSPLTPLRLAKPKVNPALIDLAGP
jgi:EAL domain-containing protein (putative c-di-GMP-specific phosphodiesterase class I)